MATKKEYGKRIHDALTIPYKDGLPTIELMSKIRVNIDDKADVRTCYNALADQRNTRKGGKLKFKKKGRKKINFFPENEELVNKKWDFQQETNNRYEYLELRRSHSKDIHENIIMPLFNRFKKVHYGWENNPIDEKEQELFSKIGPVYWETVWGNEKGMHIPVYQTVKSSVLLDDYLHHHSPDIGKMIEEFDADFNKFWMDYFEIHEEIRNILCSRMNLPITMYEPGVNTDLLENIESVTTNLQYEFADSVIFRNIFDDDYFYFPFHVKEHNTIFECWSSNITPGKCYLREKSKGRNEKEFSNQIKKKINMIFSEIKKSEELQEMSNEIKELYNSLLKQQYEILRCLDRDIHKEVLDGICDLSIIKNEVETGKKQDEFNEIIFHQYFHKQD